MSTWTLRTRDLDIIRDVPQVVAQLRKIHAQGTGVLGMKLIGEGRFTKPEDREASIRFVMGLGSVDAVTIGFKSAAEVDEAIERERVASLTSRRRLTLSGDTALLGQTRRQSGGGVAFGLPKVRRG